MPVRIGGFVVVVTDVFFRRATFGDAERFADVFLRGVEPRGVRRAVVTEFSC